MMLIHHLLKIEVDHDGQTMPENPPVSNLFPAPPVR
jgi:hypothetical protein